MFDEDNLILPAIFLSFCLSVHNTYVQPWLWGYVFFAITFVFFSHNFHNRKREIFAFFVSERNAKSKQNVQEKKRFFLFAGNPTYITPLYKTGSREKEIEN